MKRVHTASHAQSNYSLIRDAQWNQRAITNFQDNSSLIIIIPVQLTIIINYNDDYNKKNNNKITTLRNGREPRVPRFTVHVHLSCRFLESMVIIMVIILIIIIIIMITYQETWRREF